MGIVAIGRSAHRLLIQFEGEIYGNICIDLDQQSVSPLPACPLFIVLIGYWVARARPARYRAHRARR